MMQADASSRILESNSDTKEFERKIPLHQHKKDKTRFQENMWKSRMKEATCAIEVSKLYNCLMYIW